MENLDGYINWLINQKVSPSLLKDSFWKKLFRFVLFKRSIFLSDVLKEKKYPGEEEDIEYDWLEVLSLDGHFSKKTFEKLKEKLKSLSEEERFNIEFEIQTKIKSGKFRFMVFIGYLCAVTILFTRIIVKAAWLFGLIVGLLMLFFLYTAFKSGFPK